MNFEERVTQFITEHQLIISGMRLVAGVSGGADSMALIDFLREKRDIWELKLAVCSVDHGLRGEESRQDLEYVATYCRENDLPFYGKTVDARAYSREKQMSIEVGARELRYQAFAEAVGRFSGDALVLAHHGDDQIETMLMREARGSFGMSRSGIPVRRPFAGAELIRPFLTQTKSDLEAYCAVRGIRPRYDASNDSDRHTRNRFRKNILPFFKKENPSVHLKFQYESERIAEDEMFLLQLAKKELKTVIREESDDQVKLSISALLSIPSPLQRRIIHLILNYLYTNQQIKPLHQSIHIENLMRLLRSDRASGGTFFPEKLAARKSYDMCVIGFLSRDSVQSYEQVLQVPGVTALPSGEMTAEYLEGNFPAATGRNCLILDPQQFQAPLRVRNWKIGDRMTTNGMSHTQKVHRIFINEKIDREKRGQWPVVVDGKGTILWLPLLRRARPFPPGMTDCKGTYLKLVFTPIDDFGGTQE